MSRRPSDSPSLEENQRRILEYSKLSFLVCLSEDKVVAYTYAVITLPNERSINLHEALEFKKDGIYLWIWEIEFKLGEWHHVGW